LIKFYEFLFCDPIKILVHHWPSVLSIHHFPNFFQISDGSNDFYTLETLCHFVRIKVAAGISHQAYARQAAVDGLIPVNNLDGIKLTDYLYGKTKKVPDNVKQISHKQLNPHLLNYDLTGLKFIIVIFILEFTNSKVC